MGENGKFLSEFDKEPLKKKESGCVDPLYGKKSKCIINIVPKSKKCKSFNIDKQCILKR